MTIKPPSRFLQVPQRVAVADTRTVRPPPKLTDGFYLTPEWRRLVERLVAVRGRRCQACGRTSERGKRLRVYGDHIVELADGGAPLDPSNIRLLCGSCHVSKTAAERGRRVARGVVDAKEGPAQPAIGFVRPR